MLSAELDGSTDAGGSALSISELCAIFGEDSVQSLLVFWMVADAVGGIVASAGLLLWTVGSFV